MLSTHEAFGSTGISIEEMTSVFREFCADYGFTALVQGADKHGSFVWEAEKRDRLSRSVMLGFTSLLVEDLPGDLRTRLFHNYGARDDGTDVILVDVTVAAGDATKFMNRVIWSHCYPQGRAISEAMTAGLLRKHLDRAGRLALQIRENELVECYITPR